jgi:small-conductance mechanosensitive channel
VSATTLLLGVSSVLLISASAIPYGFPRRVLWMRVSWNLVTFAILTALLYKLVGSPFRPTFQAPEVDEQFWEQLIEASWWLLGARVAVGLARVFVVMEGRPRETQIISDLLAGAIYVASLLAVIAIAFSVPLGSLLATSGVIAIVLGLALQSTLSDVFSGIAVGIERPYKAGDLIWIEGGIEGRVTQVTWRSTHVSTDDGNIAIIPNSVVAKARLINRSLPSEARSDSLEMRLDPRASVADCRAALTAAVKACRLPFASPEVEILCTGVLGDGAVYEITFSVTSSRRLGALRSELYAEVQRHLRYAGIALAVNGQSSVPGVAVPNPIDLLTDSDLFNCLDENERFVVAHRMQAVKFDAGAVIITEGNVPDAMFIIASGALDITVAEKEQPRLVHRMGPGESLGVIGLILGRPYAASATARTDVKVWKVAKGDVTAMTTDQDSLKGKLNLIAERGLSILKEDPFPPVEASTGHSDVLLTRVQALLHSFS